MAERLDRDHASLVFHGKRAARERHRDGKPQQLLHDYPPNVTFANLRFPTFNRYDFPAPASSAWRVESIFTSSTSTPPCAIRRCASLFDSARPARVITLASSCGSGEAGKVFSSMSVGSWRSLKTRRESASAASG